LKKSHSAEAGMNGCIRRWVFIVAWFVPACTHTSEIGYERGMTTRQEMFRRIEGNEVAI
jgi:hypothetical protein